MIFIDKLDYFEKIRFSTRCLVSQLLYTVLYIDIVLFYSCYSQLRTTFYCVCAGFHQTLLLASWYLFEKEHKERCCVLGIKFLTGNYLTVRHNVPSSVKVLLSRRLKQAK